MLVLALYALGDTLVCDHSDESHQLHFHVIPFIILYKMNLSVAIF